MKFKGTLSLFVVLAVLGGWVYWTDIRGREERDRAEEAAGRVLGVDADEITGISLVYPDRTLAASRNNDGWEFRTPEGLEADRAAWNTLAEDIGRIERGAVVVEADADPGVYGLDVPGISVEVELAEGRNEQIRFGDPNPAGAFHYTTLSSAPEVFLTASRWRSLFDKQADDLRDKTVLRFEQGEIDEIRLPGTSIRLTKADNEWFIEGGSRLRADDTEVASFLGALSTARARGFGAPDRMGSGATNSIVLRSSTSGAEHVLVFGGAVEGDPALVYARDDSRDTVFTVDRGLLDRALSPPSVWRDKTITDFEPDAVTTIEIIRGDEVIGITRSVEGGWRLGDGRRAREDRVDAMLTAFDFQEALEVIDAPGPASAYGLDDPAVQVGFGGASGDLVRFAFGGTASDNGRYWRSRDEMTVKIVPASILTPFDRPADDLAEPGDEP